MKKYRIIYEFKSSKFGFQNSITVFNINPEFALKQASEEVSKCYGSKMLRRFEFKQPIEIN